MDMVGGLPELNAIEKKEDNVLTAAKFLEVTRNCMSISVGKDESTGGLFVVVRYYSDEHKDNLIKTYQGPDPMTTTYNEYMRFLAELYSVPGIGDFVETYQKSILRRMGRMTK